MKPRDIIILAVIALLGCFLASCNNDKQVNQLVTQANQLQSEGKYDKSLETLNRALKLNPSGKVETRILLERSMIYVDLNQFENALNDLKKILDSSVQDKTKATALLTRGYIFYQQQKYAEALEEFERVKKLVEEPSMLAYLYQLEGSTYQAMGKNKEALASYTESINQDPGMNEVFLSRAEVYAELGQYRRAREDAEMYSSKNINNPEALYNLGIYSRMSGEPKEAEKYLNEAIALEPDDPLYRFERGFLFLITKQFDKAEEDFNKLLELAPENPLGLLGRASVYEETHKYQKALELYNQVIKKYPDNFLAYTSRGDYYSLVKDYEETIADFDKAIELTSGEDESVYIDRAEKFELFGEYKQSEEDLKKALELDENNYFALMNLAVLNIKQGNREKARQNLEKANANSVENEIIADLYPALYYFYDRDYKEVIERTTRLKQNYLKTDMAPVEAISYYFLKDPETALKTIKFALSQDSGEPYLNIFNYIFAKKNGIDKKQELTKFLKNSEIAAWPIPVVKLYAGQISPKQFLKQLNQLKDPVSKRLIQTEAYYYLGQFYLFNNDKNMAKKYFQQTEKSSVINEEFVLAEYELNKLK